jgi:ABC-type Fe3+/spermidine/putrescine transport system ATPase subunit
VVSAALEVRGVTVSPGATAVLRGLDLDVAAGSRTALVGPSGAGKTTLLRAIAGLEALDEGEIRLGGRSLAGVPAHRRRVAVVFQEPRLLAHLTVAENVALPLRATGAGRAERRRRAAELLDAVGLATFAQRRVPGLSGGEQQRVALARALCAEPELLLLDEPLAALDPARREGLRRLLVELQEARGLTTLVVTHDRAEAAELGRRVALLLEGRIVQEDEPRALFERPASATVARFFGAVLLRGEVRDGLFHRDGLEVEVGGPDGPAVLAVRPEHLRLDGGGGGLRGRVEEAVFTGTAVRLRVAAGDARLTVLVAPDEAPPAGAEVGLTVERAVRLPGEVPAGT